MTSQLPNAAPGALDDREALRACVRELESTGRLLKALSVLGEATATIRQVSRRTQDLQVDLRSFRSPLAWDGRAPWET